MSAKADKESILIKLVVNDRIVENKLRFLIFYYIPGNYCLLCLEVLCQAYTLAVTFPSNRRARANFDALKILCSGLNINAGINKTDLEDPQT